MDRRRAEFDAMARSLWNRIETVRTESRWLAGKLLLVKAAGTGDIAARSEAGRLSLKLAAEGTDYALAWSLLLEATLLAQDGKPAGAQERLRQAATTAERAGLRLVAAAARRRLGELLGGAEGDNLVNESEVAMKREGIVSPPRMTCVLAPGFSSFF